VAVAREMGAAVEQKDARAELRRTPLRDRAPRQSGADDHEVIDGHAAFDRAALAGVSGRSRFSLWEAYFAHGDVHDVDEIAE